MEGRNEKLIADGAPLAINEPSVDTKIKHGGSGGYIYL